MPMERQRRNVSKSSDASSSLLIMTPSSRHIFPPILGARGNAGGRGQWMFAGRVKLESTVNFRALAFLAIRLPCPC